MMFLTQPNPQDVEGEEAARLEERSRYDSFVIWKDDPTIPSYGRRWCKTCNHRWMGPVECKHDNWYLEVGPRCLDGESSANWRAAGLRPSWATLDRIRRVRAAAATKETLEVAKLGLDSGG